MYVTRLKLFLILLFSTLVYTTGATMSIASDIRATPAPIEVQSQEAGGFTAADISGTIDQRYSLIAPALADAARWCEFLPLSLNIKSCTHQREGAETQVTLYAGRKFYQTPDDSHRLIYRFHVVTHDENALKIMMDAEHGPYGTRDSRIELTATPMGDRTFVRVHVSQRTSFMARLAAQSYLTTLGKDKVGFSVTGHTRQGEPIYVKGVQGVIERNGVRYYLALQAYAASQSLPPADRLAARMRMWYDMTERYPSQLHEMGRDEYLHAKMKEWANQRALQEALNPPADARAMQRSANS